MLPKGAPLLLLACLAPGCCSRDFPSDRCCGVDTFGGGVIHVAITDSSDPAYDLMVDIPGLTVDQIASLGETPERNWDDHEFEVEGGGMLQVPWGQDKPVQYLFAAGTLPAPVAPCGDDLPFLSVHYSGEEGGGFLYASFGTDDDDQPTADPDDGYAKVGASVPYGVAYPGNVRAVPTGTSGELVTEGDWGCRGNPTTDAGISSTITVSWEMDPEVYTSHDLNCWAGNGLFGWW